MPRPDPHAPYDHPIEVAPTDIDALGHVNNVVHVRWVQDAAVAHWKAVADEEEQRTLLWVVVRHEIDYLRQAFVGDALVARTWVGRERKRGFERHTEVIRKEDGKPVAKALTLWCPIDAETKRPVAPPDRVRQRWSRSE